MALSAASIGYTATATEANRSTIALVALRRASWSFLDSLVRSERFDALYAELAAVEAQLALLAEDLVALLHTAVRGASNARQRHELMSVKRAVFNQRPLSARDRLTVEGFSDELSHGIARYSALLQRKSVLGANEEEAIEAEVLAALLSRVRGQSFRLALRASSPTLAAALQRCEAGTPLSRRDARSLYAYVCRFASKANPLHLFAHFVPGAGFGRPAPAATLDRLSCEIVFDIESLFQLERELLSRPLDPSRVYVDLNPILRKDDQWQLWLKHASSWATATLRDARLIRELREAFDRREPGDPLTIAALESELVGDPGESTRQEARKAIDALISRGVIRRFLIDDLRKPSRHLEGLHEDVADLARCIERWHLALVQVDDIPRLDDELGRAVRRANAAAAGVTYSVNSYAADDVIAAERAMLDVSRPLSDLKPVLTTEHNFSAVQRVTRRFLSEATATHGSRPYLELLAEFLRRRKEILDRLEWGSDAPEYRALAARCAALEGELTSAELRSLVQGIGSRADRSVCVVGPFDFASRRLFISNVFAGNRRFVSRYLVGHENHERPRVDSARQLDDSLDVELAMPREHSLNLVARRFDVGFGFERRWARGYRQWIDPAQVMVSVENGTPRFTDVDSGRRLRFHYNGMLLAAHLPVEYQLLLDGHADTYRNPFSRDFAKLPGVEIEHRRGLFYGPVCLRRESWWLSSSTLHSFTRNATPVKLALALRRFIHRYIVDDDLWFFRMPARGRQGEKPRFVDLASPLSAMAMLHALGTTECDVALTRMEPGPGGLWRLDGKGFVTEMMMEL